MAMLEGKKEISLTDLNRMTHAWVEMDYHHQIHSETTQTPIDRFSSGPSVLRPSGTSIDFRLAFRMESPRTQRRSDGTTSIEGVRFEIPGRFRHMHKITVRFARWDLSEVSLVSQETNQILCALYPLDKEKNSNARRRQIAEPSIDSPLENRDTEALPPYLLELMKRFDESGFPPPFITQD